MKHSKAVHLHIGVARSLTELLDSKFSIGGFRFGLDPIIGAFPVIGDIIGLILSIYLVWIGLMMKIPDHEVRIMMGNVIFDFIFGLIPFIGDIGDFVFKANSRNFKILEKYLSPDVIEGELQN